jgi:acetyl esterase/lipase
VVVLVPGGSWLTADRSGLGGLAESLAAGGAAAVNVTYRAADDGVRFPAPVQDVVCAVDAAVDRVRRAGRLPGPVVVLGHSAGGHLAALAALAGERFRPGCPYPAATVTGLVGLAGAYDIAWMSDVAAPLFGTSLSADPQHWREGNPLTYLAVRTTPPLRVLLVTGGRDTLIPPGIAPEFAGALRAAGNEVRLINLPQASHATIFTAPLIAAPLQAWLASLPAG